LRPRILQLLDSFNQGGSERQALEQVRLLQASGKYEVFLASLSPEGVLRAEAEKMGLGEIPSYPLKSFYDLNTLTQLRRFVSICARKGSTYFRLKTFIPTSSG
jgi:hypothetical protein